MSIFNYRKQPGYFKRLSDALKSTSDDIALQIGRWTGSAESPITEKQIEDLEEVLLGSDLGVETTFEVLDKIRALTAGSRFVTSHQVRRLIREELLGYLGSTHSDEIQESRARPQIWFVVGVNGVGKTTTIGKLARLLRLEGQSVLFAASDTFRAAAIDQLGVWAERTGADLVKQKPGADPAAVLHDAITAGRARRADVILVDTAGRIHTKGNLMQELDKMRRVAGREVEAAPHQVLLILDATTGQNGLHQAREFLRSSGVTGLIVTKLDGTAKGGILVAIARELKIPISFIGVGERAEDLLPFDQEAYVDSLLQRPDASSQGS